MGAPTYAEALARGSTEVLFTVTPSGRVLAWSHGAQMAFGWARDEAIGRLIVALAAPAEDVERVQGALREAAERGEAFCDGLRRHKDGGLLPGPLPMRIVREGEGASTQLTFLVGRQAAQAREASPAAPATLVPVHAGPAPAADPLREPLTRVLAALRADAVALFVLDPKGDLAIRAIVHAEGAAGLPPPRAAARALHGTHPVALDPDEPAYRALLGVSVRVEGAPIGVLQVASRAPRAFSPEEMRVLGVAADLLGWALASPPVAAPALPPSREDLAALRAEADRIMEASHEPSVLLGALARLLVPRLADWCAVDLVEPSSAVRRIAFVHRDTAREELGRGALDVPGAGAPLSPAEAIRTARVLTRLEGEEDAVRGPDESRVLEALGGASWAVIPISGRVRVLGAISLGQENATRALRAEDVAWTRDLARRAALEVENARLHDMVQRSRDQANRAVGRARMLQEVAASLSEALTPTEVTEVIVRRAREAIGASGGALAVLADDRTAFEIVGSVGAAEALSNAWRRFPVHARVPLADAGRSREDVLVDSASAGIARYPHLAAPAVQESVGALIALPLIVDGRTVGAMGLVFDQRHAFDPDELSFLRTLARQCGDALERTRLLNAERSARASADVEARRSAFLADASRILAQSFDYEQTLSAMARALVPVFADWCLVHLLESDGKIASLVSVHGDSTKASLVDETRWMHPLDANAEAGIPRVMRTGRPEIHFDVPDALVDRLAANPDHAALLRRIGMRSQMTVPMIARGRVLGAITFRQSGLRRFGVNDVNLAEELALRAALAVDNARLFREAQEAFLRREETLALLGTLLSSAPIGIAFLDRDLKVRRLNAALEAAGARPEAVGEDVGAALPFLSPRVIERVRDVLRTGQPAVDIEVAEERVDAPRHWLASCYPVQSQGGTVMGVGFVMTEITERKRAEEALRESEERYRALIEGVKDHAIISLDHEGRIASWNAGAQSLHGYAAEEALGKLFTIFHTAEEKTRGTAKRELETALATGRCEAEGWRVRKDGSRFYANILITPLFDASGALRGFSKLTRDMTDARRAREDIERARQQVARSEKLSTMGTLVSGVAHEIRTPLTAIANSLYMMKLRLDRAKTTDDLRAGAFAQNMDMALESIDRINRLVQDLRRFTKANAAVLRSPAGLHEVAEEALGLFRAAYRGRIEVLPELAPTAPCEVDRAQVHQVALNLLQNAAEAMPHGGRVRLATGMQGGQAFLLVEDHGMGMPPEVHRRMFEEFFTTKPEGTGLGLSIVRRIVETHGGRIECDTEPGRGTIFTILFPPVGAPRAG